MNTAVDALSMFSGFFDDAATFPPGLAPLEVAVAGALARRGSATAPTVGPSVIKFEDVAEARQIALRLGGRAADPLPLSVVVPAGSFDAALVAAAEAEPFWRLAAIELKAGDPAAATWERELRHAAATAPVAVYAELGQQHMDRGGLELLAGTALRLKYRTGGLVADAFPSPEQFARVVVSAVTRSIPFKLTAGLHRAVRYTDPATGFTHHGFLNIAHAVDAARRGADQAVVADILAGTDGDALAAWATSSDGSWRQSFVSFGTCSVDEPLESLNKLGLIDPGALGGTNPAQHTHKIQEKQP